MDDYPKNKPRWLVIAAIIVIPALLAGFWMQRSARAQTGDTSWSEPVNLSQSGSTSAPNIVIDSNGLQHAIWKDDYAGYVYSRGENGSWSTPTATTFPFTTDDSPPKLLADLQGRILAFWTIADGTLEYSDISSSDFGRAATWSAITPLAESALAYDISVDGQNNIHLAYVRDLDSPDFPSGIYYRGLRNGSQAWTSGEVIYPSLYYRSIGAEDAHVRVDSPTTDGSNQVYVVWDNRSRNRVFFAKSGDGGQSWIDPQEIAGPAEDAPDSSPFNIDVAANQQGILLTWENGQPNIICTSKYRWSIDGGETWSDAGSMLTQISGCPTQQYIITTTDNLNLLYADVFDQVYFTAWNGSQWSDPRVQSVLTTFDDPDSNISIDFRCHKSTSDQGTLYVIGCDNGVAKDTWLLTRPITNLDDWFPPATSLIYPSSVYSTTKTIEHPNLLADSQARVHILWNEDNQIIYTRTDQGSWLTPITIMHSTGDKIVGISTAIGSQNRIHMVFTDSSTGQVYYTWGSVDQATSPTEWPDPLIISGDLLVSSAPDLYIDLAGNLYAIFAVTLNEGRGVYMVYSEDNGLTWSSPILIFDATSQGWEMVDSPKISSTVDGKLVAIWERRSIPSGPGSLGLFYSDSTDNGQTWSAPYSVTDQPIAWSDILRDNNQTLHRVWSEIKDDRREIIHEYSFDSGITWARASSLSNLGDVNSPATVSADQSGQLHLLRFIQNPNGYLDLTEWTWNNGRWDTTNAIQIDEKNIDNIAAIQSAINQNNQLFTIYTHKQASTGTDHPASDSILFSQHAIAAGSISPTETGGTQPAETPAVSTTLAPTNTPFATPTLEVLTPTPAATLALPDIPVSGGGFLSGQTGGMVVGGVVAVITILALILVANRMRQ